MPLGPFANINGHGHSSPILADGMLILVVDQNDNSYIMAVDPDSGRKIWKTDRSETTRSYGTAGVFRPSDAPSQLVVPGAYRLISYELRTGKKLWWVDRMAWQVKCVPLFDGDTIYVNAWENGGDEGQRR
ncbi:MAG: PQQ-binding-like beta-propeller repeat protein [Bryobacterales bacterium]